MASKRPPVNFAGGKLEITNTTGDPLRTELTLDGEPLTSVVRLKLDVQVDQGIAVVSEHGQFAALPVEVYFANPRLRLIADPVFPEFVAAEIRAALAEELARELVRLVADSIGERTAADLVALAEPVVLSRVSRVFGQELQSKSLDFMRQSPANKAGDNGIPRNGSTETGERAGSDG
jgi:hypothetical protein